jgi:hypothetical protein
VDSGAKARGDEHVTMDVSLTADALTTSLVGLVGVLIGAVVAPIFTARHADRTAGRLAAQSSVDLLRKWQRATKIAGEQVAAHRDKENGSVLMAHAAPTLYESLDVTWWEENRLAMMRTAQKSEIDTLSDLADHCRYHLFSLRQVGDGGHEIAREIAGIKHRQSELEREYQAEARADEQIFGSRQPRGPSSVAGEDDEQADALLKDGARLVAASREDSHALADGLLDLKIDVALMDHRIQLAPTALTNLANFHDLVEEGVATCKLIERRNTSRSRRWRSNREQARRSLTRDQV